MMSTEHPLTIILTGLFQSKIFENIPLPVLGLAEELAVLESVEAPVKEGVGGAGEDQGNPENPKNGDKIGDDLW